MILDYTISIGHKVIKSTNSAKEENNIDHIRIYTFCGRKIIKY